MDTYEKAAELMKQQLGHDVVIALATCGDSGVTVRNVDGYYKDGKVYVVTYESSRKMLDIQENSAVAICKDLMNAQGIGKNLGNPKEVHNLELRQELKEVFSAFYERHVNEDDPKTCILEIQLSSAVAFSRDTKFVIDYRSKTASATPFVNDIV